MTPEQMAAEIGRLHEQLRHEQITASVARGNIERLVSQVKQLRQGEYLAKAAAKAADLAEKNAVEAAAASKYIADNSVRWAREDAAEKVRAAQAETAAARADAQVWREFALAVAQVVGAPEPTPRDLPAVFAGVQALAAPAGGQP